MPASPVFLVDDLVYLLESAKLGFLDSYNILSSRQITNGEWVYTVGFKAAPPVGKRSTGRAELPFELAENELTDKCTAIGLVVDRLSGDLQRMQLIQQQACGESDSLDPIITSPKFNVEDIVFLQESAALGNLESYVVAEVIQQPSGNFTYKFAVPERPPVNNTTVGDRNNLRQSQDFELLESELLTQCEAVALGVTKLQQDLNKVQQLQATFCSETGTG